MPTFDDIETVDDLCRELAEMFDLPAVHDDEKCDNEEHFCRGCFVAEFGDRMRTAVNNENVLGQMGVPRRRPDGLENDGVDG